MTHPRLHASTAERAENDFYPTPPEFTHALLDNWCLPKSIWEPAAGQGDMVRVLEQRGHVVTATDISTGHDFFLTEPAPATSAIVTNPPFSRAAEFADRALSMAPVVALLFPIYFLGGTKRAKTLWQQHPPQATIIIPWRMRHERGTSHFNHIWVVWDRTQFQADTMLIWAKESNTCQK